MSAALEQLTDIVDRVVDNLMSCVIDPQSVGRAQRVAEASGERLDLVLNRLGLVPDQEWAAAWSEATGDPVCTLPDYPSEPVLADVLDPSFLRHASLIPVAVTDEYASFASLTPLDRDNARALEWKLEREVRKKVARPGEFWAAFQRLYPDDWSANRADVPGADSSDLDRLRDLASDAPVIKLASRIIDRAVELRASDIHLSAMPGGSRLRYRIDGILRDQDPPPAGVHAALLSRLKIMAGLDIGETRLPQDGRIRSVHRGRELDIRVVTVPHLAGEGVVLRILDRSGVRLDLETLGFDDVTRTTLSHAIDVPHGLFLVTGPTGSGKTTTLYACLQTISRAERNIITVEDPVEFQIEGVNQIQIHKRIGLDFPSVLRSVLRQDPDIIMVGEIRDEETAAIANQAALTGHLVLATLHTNSAAGALPRLLDMGLEPYLLASTFRGALAQRLVRRLCPHCHTLGPAAATLPEMWYERIRGRPVGHAVGCESCVGQGYVGRLAVTEILTPSDWLGTLLQSRADEATYEQRARSAGWLSLVDDGLGKAVQGLTSVEEVARVAAGT